MTENGDETPSLKDSLRQAISRFHWRRVQLMRTDWMFRQQNWLMIIGSIPACLFCVMWLFIVDDPDSPHRFALGANLFLGLGAILFGLAVIWGVKLWVDFRNSD